MIHPVSALLAAARARPPSYEAIVGTGHAGATDRMGWSELTDLIGLPEQLRLEARYATPVGVR